MITSKKGKLAKYYVDGMTPQRYEELTISGGPLTDDELENGWYWSDEFDDLLIHKSWPEAEF